MESGNYFLDVQKAVKRLLETLEHRYAIPVSTDENFRDTPTRVARMYHEIFVPAKYPDVAVGELMKKTFPGAGGEMILVRGIRVFGLCPHHMLPVDYRVSAAYLPAPGGHVVGLSKIPRVAELLARRPILHEDFVGQVADALMEIPECRGSACYAEGRHYCMVMRGVQQHESETTASALRGAFMDEPATRAEFLDLARKGEK